MADTDDDDDSTRASSNEGKFRPLIPQAWVGLVDAISLMVVTPSLIFYVLERGGTKEQYGIILSIFSFGSFVLKPALGFWSDKTGSKFRAPYLTSIGCAALGGLLYFLAGAGAFHGQAAIALILMGRLLGGFGAANATLGYTYVAQVMPQELLTQGNAVLSMVRVAGMTLAPVFNSALGGVNFSLSFGSYHMNVDPLNSVGLMLFFGNISSLFVVYFMLHEPDVSTKPTRGENNVDERSWQFWKNVFSAEILVPISILFTLNVNFQLLETGLAPAANDLLGWTAVGISTLFSINSVVLFTVILLTFKLASMGVTDSAMLKMGLTISALGYSLLYVWWKRGANVFQFVLPVLVCTMVFPILASPSRGLYTRLVIANECLSNHQGTMQALASMAVSSAGIVGPGAIAAFVLRTSDEVTTSRDQREFTAWALFAPVLSLGTLLGVYYLSRKPDVVISEEEAGADFRIDERWALLGSMPAQPFHPRTDANRRMTTTMMHIPQISFHDEYGRRHPRHTTIF